MSFKKIFDNYEFSMVSIPSPHGNTYHILIARQQLILTVTIFI